MPNSFRCPSCGSFTRVVNSRPNHRGVYRRRECQRGCRFTTQEALVGSDILGHLEQNLLRKIRALLVEFDQENRGQ